MLEDGPLPSAVGRVGGGAPVVLIVDDEKAFCTVVAEVLEWEGLVVRQAHSADQALSLLEEIAPDLILTDLMMPEVDGLSFIRRLREDPAWSETPIILVSAWSDPDTLQSALEAGANSCLTKPFSVDVLRESVLSFVKPS